MRTIKGKKYYPNGGNDNSVYFFYIPSKKDVAIELQAKLKQDGVFLSQKTCRELLNYTADDYIQILNKGTIAYPSLKLAYQDVSTIIEVGIKKGLTAKEAIKQYLA